MHRCWRSLLRVGVRIEAKATTCEMTLRGIPALGAKGGQKGNQHFRTENHEEVRTTYESHQYRNLGRR
jgi:hypothetical protein